MLTRYPNKLLRPSPDAPRAACPTCGVTGRLVVVHVHGKAQQRVVGCRCERPSNPRQG